MFYNGKAEAAQALRDSFGHQNLVARRKRYYVTRIGFKRRARHRKPFAIGVVKTITIPMRVAA